MTIQQIEEFEAVTRPVIAWLNANCHPHSKVAIEADKAALHEAVFGYKTFEYVRD